MGYHWLYRGYTGVMGIMEKQMETTIMGYTGLQGSCTRHPFHGNVFLQLVCTATGIHT